jgi:acetylornithine deacetylase/succinyl-diaminopimelate desuccinylase-like protein
MWRTTGIILLLGGLAAAQAPAAAQRYTAAHRRQLMREFSDLLAIPNQASDRANIERNAAAIVQLYEAQGVKTELLRVPDAPPVVFGRLDRPGAARTITFYAHYDGQPVHPAEWTQPPYQPMVRDGRIWARSAGDDKAAVFGFTAALAALRAAGIHPAVNLHFFLEGEEEAGSPHLAEFLAKYADTLRTDAWVICDGPVHQSGRMQVFFGARGVAEVEMTVYGPGHGLHDGHYGNWAPNPITMLVHLLASMRDDNAHILIPGFYGDVQPLSAAERQAIAEMPPYDHTLAHDLELGRTEGAPAALAEQIAKPALNIRGIQGGFVGKGAANVISTEATASLDFRLVPDETPAHVRELVERFIARQGYAVIDHAPSADERRANARLIRLQWGSGYPAAQVPLDAPFSRQVVRLVQAASPEAIVRLPIMGGSVPMYLFQGTKHIPAIGVPIANYDDNQHSANENLRLDYLWQGIAVYASLFAGLR